MNFDYIETMVLIGAVWLVGTVGILVSLAGWESVL